MATTAHLGGIPLILTGGASWSMTSGPTPQRGEFEIAAFDEPRALELAKTARNAVTLELAGRTFKGLSILHTLPSTVTAKRRVVVVDRRHWWERKHYYRAVNMPRRVGQQKRQGVGWVNLVDLPGLAQFAPGLTFYTHSLKSPTEAWSPQLLWEDIIAAIDPKASILVAEGLDLNAIPLQGLELDGNGQEAVQQALSRMGAVDITINPLGQIVIYSWRARTELGVLGPGDSTRQYGSAGPGIWSRGTAEVVSFAAEAPEYVDVLFTPELEVLFRFTADPTPAGDTSFSGAAQVDPTVVNVIVNPVQVLAIPGTSDTLTSGDYIEIARSLVAYTALASSGGTPGNMPVGLSLEHLRQAILPRNGAILHRALDTLISKSPSTVAVNWSEIVGALMGGFRQLWQIPQEWVNNSLSIQPYLVGTWNTESGQRASSVVWCDHTIFPNAQGRWIAGKTADKMPWCIEVSTSYPATGGIDHDPTATNPPGPFAVEVKDRDQGIIATPQSVATATQNKALIGLMTNLPTGAIRASNGGAVFLNSPDIKSPTGSLPSLSSSMRIAFILTMTPARVLTRVRIRPADIGIGWPCTGPPMEVRAREETARYSWAHERRQDVIEVFGLNGNATRASQDLALERIKAVACVNLVDSNQGAASITAIAKGYALDVYSRFEPRLMGSRVADLRGPAADVIPSGGIATVTHSVDARGVATTSIVLRMVRPALNLLSLLPSAARAIIMRLIPWKQGQ